MRMKTSGEWTSGLRILIRKCYWICDANLQREHGGALSVFQIPAPGHRQLSRRRVVAFVHAVQRVCSDLELLTDWRGRAGAFR